MKFICLILLFVSCGKSPLFSNPAEIRTKSENTNAILASDEFVWNQNFHFGIQWLSKPSIGNKITANIKFWDDQKYNFLGPYEKLTKPVCVFLWMKMADGSEHGSSPIVISEKSDYYFLDEIYFIMSGDWELRIRTIENESQCRGNKNDEYINEKIIHIKL